MYKVTVKGKATVVVSDYEGNDVVFDNLSELNGIDCQDCFCDYIDDDYDGAVSGGYMDFRYEDGELITYTVYDSKRELTDDELAKLEGYTSGQWSDGIGEGFEQVACAEVDEGEVFISPWFGGQTRTITQEKV